MKKWITIWQKTIFRRLVFTFLLVLLPIYLIGINIYNWGFRAINDDITKSMTAQVSFYLGQLEAEIQRIKVQQDDCMNDENLKALVFIPNTMTAYGRSQAAFRLKYRLNAIKNSSSYIRDVKVSVSTLDYTISGASGMNFYNEKKQDISAAPTISGLSQIIYHQGNYHLFKSYRSTYRDEILYWIDITLDNGIFTNDLGQFNTFEDSLSMLYCPATDVFLASGGAGGDLRNLQDSLKQQVNRSTAGSYSVVINNRKYYSYYDTTEYLGLTLARYVPENVVLSQVIDYQRWLWVFLAMSLLIVVLFSVSIYNSIHKPLNILLGSFEKVEGGDLSIAIEHRHNDEFKHLYRSFNKMVKNLQALIDQAYKQKILMQHAELKQLQAQINPHFLYNSFFILYSIARAGDHDTVMLFLQQLGSYFKYITRSAEDEVPLSAEAEHARIYASIQALRFSNRITIDFGAVPDEFCNVIVPRLIIQPIIENSFKYGLEQKASKGILNVCFIGDGDYLRIVIEDNGNGMDQAELHALREALADKTHAVEATGIVNIHRRLQLRFGGNSGLSVDASELGGLRVAINIQLQGGAHV